MTQAAADLAPGFADPPTDAAFTFRAILEALSRPGRIVELPVRLTPPAPFNEGSAAIALTLCDHDTPVWLDAPLRTRAIEAFLAFHCGCPVVAHRADAAFAFFGAPQELRALDGFRAGTPDYPDRSATLVLQVSRLDGTRGAGLTGPGIETQHRLAAAPLDARLWRLVSANNARYPLGADFLFAGTRHVAACPRSTRVDIAEDA